jgi:hypothetical protein
MKMDVHIWQFITAMYARHSTATGMYRSTSMNHTRWTFINMSLVGAYLLHLKRIWAYLAYIIPKDNVTYLLLSFALFAMWHFAATIHTATNVLERIVAIQTR